ncbi:MAG: hypothetical protein P8Q94_06640 [Candidatus Poseidoniaceae archaeon]|nr:hypothetical protein [Candidatus Poseidoniaceae archaeon]
MGKRGFIIFFAMCVLFPLDLFENTTTASVDDAKKMFHVEENQDLELRIHPPGTFFDENEKLSWSPNNISSENVMQISIVMEEIINQNAILSIETLAYWDGTTSSVLQFSNTTVNHELMVINKSTVVTYNVSYPNTVWGGDYSLNVTMNFQDSTNLEIDYSGIKFQTYDYHIYENKNQEVILLCSCETIESEILIRNTGEIETILQINVSLDSAANEIAKVEFVEQDSMGIVLLESGEVFSTNISIMLDKDNIIKNNSLDIPININVSYEDDDGNLISLYEQYYFLKTVIVDSNNNPEVSLDIPEYNNVLTSNGFNKLRIPQNGNDSSLFFLGNTEYTTQISVQNLGFYNEELTIISNNSQLNQMVLYQNNLYIINDFNELKINIGTYEIIELKILVQNPTNIIMSDLKFTMHFSESYYTDIELNFVDAPPISTTVILSSNNQTTETELPIDEDIALHIDLSDYEALDFFENRWFLTCLIESTNNSVNELIGIQCNNQNILIQPLIDGSDNYSFYFNLLNLSDELNSNFSVRFEISHQPLTRNSSIIHFITLDYLIDLTNQNDNSNNQGDNTGNGGDSGSNNSTGNNNTTGTPVDDCADIQCDACPIGMVSDPNGGCCACMEAPETNVDTGDQTGEQGEQQNDDSTKTATKQSNMSTYLLLGLIIAALVAAVVIIRARKTSKTQQIVSDKTITQLPMPALPLPGLPIPSAVVVLQEWTDDNGYSWRHMSDRTIMWWNGSDWIPYGKN